MAEPLLEHDGPESVVTLLQRLMEDGQRFVRAEVRMYRAQLFNVLKQAQFAILFGFVALILAQAAIITMLVGLVMIIARYLGPGWATLIVVGVTFAIVGVLVQLALVHVRKMTGTRSGAAQ